ncbi:alkaline phosphatase PhoX [Polaribacter sp. R77954]|uniref:alkaline phosphatase PhoX n=1 Tax=Polaribacter sp. R77954 TaxID=3093870 RepID=UPI0037C53D97
MSCGNTATPTKDFNKISKERLQALKDFVIKGIPASDKDDLLLAKGLDYHNIIKWGDSISDTDTFGFNNDYTYFIPFSDDNPKDGLLWVNHEYINPLFVSDFNYQQEKTKVQVDKEMYNVGGSIVRIKEENGVWQVVLGRQSMMKIT